MFSSSLEGAEQTVYIADAGRSSALKGKDCSPAALSSFATDSFKAPASSGVKESDFAIRGITFVRLDRRRMKSRSTDLSSIIMVKRHLGSNIGGGEGRTSSDHIKNNIDLSTTSPTKHAHELTLANVCKGCGFAQLSLNV